MEDFDKYNNKKNNKNFHLAGRNLFSNLKNDFSAFSMPILPHHTEEEINFRNKVWEYLSTLIGTTLSWFLSPIVSIEPLWWWEVSVVCKITTEDNKRYVFKSALRNSSIINEVLYYNICRENSLKAPFVLSTDKFLENNYYFIMNFVDTNKKISDFSSLDRENIASYLWKHLARLHLCTNKNYKYLNNSSIITSGKYEEPYQLPPAIQKSCDYILEANIFTDVDFSSICAYSKHLISIDVQENGYCIIHNDSVLWNVLVYDDDYTLFDPNVRVDSSYIDIARYCSHNYDYMNIFCDSYKSITWKELNQSLFDACMFFQYLRRFVRKITVFQSKNIEEIQKRKNDLSCSMYNIIQSEGYKKYIQSKV